MINKQTINHTSNLPAMTPWTVGMNMPTLGYNNTAIPGTLYTNYFTPLQADFTYAMARCNGPARVAFTWERAQPTLGGALDPTYMGYIDAVAGYALAAGTTIILDCHNYMACIVSGVQHYVDNADGIVTRAHLANLWSRIATRYANNPGVSGWDIMNEPNQNGFGSTGNNAVDLPVIMQACVNAINAVETTKTIYIDGNGWSSAVNWATNNPGYPLIDIYNRIKYSAHCYPDSNGSGTDYAYADFVSASVSPSVLADRTAGFINWLALHNVQGHIGETASGVDNPLWVPVADYGLNAWKAAGIPVSWWQYAPQSGSNAYDLSPWSGIQTITWAAIQKETGIGPMNLRVSGPLNGVSGVASSAFILNKDGYVPGSVTVTPTDGGNGGTFTPSSGVLAGYNPSLSFTYTPISSVNATLTFGGTGLSTVTAPYSTVVTGAIPDTLQYTLITGTTGSLNYTVGSNANRLLLVYLTGRQAGYVTSLTCDGTAMTLVDSYNNLNTDCVYVYSLLAPSAGNHTIAVTLSSYSYISLAVQSFWNVNQTTPIEVHNNNSNYSNGSTDALTTLSNNALVVEAVTTGVSVTATPNAALTVQTNYALPSSTGQVMIGTLPVATAGVATSGLNWQWGSGSSWGSVTLSLKHA